jgi:hypothetical protein
MEICCSLTCLQGPVTSSYRESDECYLHLISLGLVLILPSTLNVGPTNVFSLYVSQQKIYIYFSHFLSVAYDPENCGLGFLMCSTIPSFEIDTTDRSFVSSLSSYSVFQNHCMWHHQMTEICNWPSTHSVAIVIHIVSIALTLFLNVLLSEEIFWSEKLTMDYTDIFLNYY